MLGAEGTARSGASASILRQQALLVLLGGFQCPPEAPGTPRPLAASSHSRRTPSAIPAAAFSSSAWSVPRARRGHRDLVLQGHSQALPPPRAAPHGWLPCFVQDCLLAASLRQRPHSTCFAEASTPVACRIHTAVRRSPANFRTLFWHLKRKSRASAVPLPPRCLRLPRTPRPGNRRLRSVSRRLPVLDGVPRSHAWPLRLATSAGVFAGFACCRERRCRIPCRSEPEPPAWTPQGLSPAVRDGALGCPEQRCHGHLWMAPFLLDTHLRGDCGSSPTPCCAP